MARQTRLTTSVIQAMLLVMLLFSLQGGISLITALFSIGDGQAINDAGSLRMRSYRLIFQTNAETRYLVEELRDFEAILTSPALSRSEEWFMPDESKERYRKVLERWETMKAYALDGNSRRYVSNVRSFVAEIDGLVKSLEDFSRKKLVMLVTSQMVSLAIMIALTLYAFSFVRRQLINPLEELERAAESIAARNFEVQPPKTHYRELDTLGNTLASAAGDLDTLYRQLEDKVSHQDLELKLAHDRISLLYESARTLHEQMLEPSTLTTVLKRLKTHLGAKHVCLKLDGESPISVPEEPTEEHQYQYPLSRGQHPIGVFEVGPTQRPDSDLMKNFALLLGRAVQVHRGSQARERLGLMEERATIARELHDSLGQLLAYMKIQLSLLARATESGQPQAIDEARLALKQSVDAAYHQLRELLTTFRLKLEASDLPSALDAMLDELRDRANSELTLNYQLPTLTLSATQQVHLLQLLREAVVNAIKHAQASKISVHCRVDGDDLMMSVEDDGVGMTSPTDGENHFGVQIMQERAKNMGGQLNIETPANGGVKVTVTLPYREEQ